MPGVDPETGEPIPEQDRAPDSPPEPPPEPVDVVLTVPTWIARLISVTLGEQPSSRCGDAWCVVVRQLAEQGVAVDLLSLESTGRGELARLVKRQNDLLAGLQGAVQRPA